MTDQQLREFHHLLWLWGGGCPGCRPALWCGCGTPEDAYIWIRDALRACPMWNHQAFWDAIPRGQRHILIGVLGVLEVIEHGGVCTGSWLTEVGREVLAVLDPLTDEEIVEAYNTAPADLYGCAGDGCENCATEGRR